MTVTESKGLKKGNRVYWRGDTTGPRSFHLRVLRGWARPLSARGFQGPGSHERVASKGGLQFK
jgi:hypothetical protein